MVFSLLLSLFLPLCRPLLLLARLFNFCLCIAIVTGGGVNSGKSRNGLLAGLRNGTDSITPYSDGNATNNWQGGQGKAVSAELDVTITGGNDKRVMCPFPTCDKIFLGVTAATVLIGHMVLQHPTAPPLPPPGPLAVLDCNFTVKHGAISINIM